MSNIIVDTANTLFWEQRNQFQYGYGGSGLVDLDGNGRNEVDCSGLVWQTLMAAGYRFDNQTRFSAKGSYAGFLRGRAPQLAEYLAVVPTTELQPGDLVVWSGHVGILESYDESRKRWTFINSLGNQEPMAF